MNCPTVDKLSQYIDHLLSQEEQTEIEAHINSCDACAEVVNAFQQEQQFIKETLQVPTLPENFNSLVLDQLEPYPKQMKPRRSAPWKRVMLTAAGIVFVVGLGTTLNPSFAQFIGGMFSTNQVDEGLQIAADAGLTKRVDLAVENQGLTLKVEDVIADSSRVTLSYQVLAKDGTPQDTYLNLADSDNAITAFDQNGKLLDRLGTGWQKGSDYGIIEFSLQGQEKLDKLTITFDLVKIDGVKGNWHLEVPVDLTENRKLTKTNDLANSTAIHHGVKIDLKKLQTAPSSLDLFFETAYTKEEHQKSEEAKHKFEEKFGKENIDSLAFGNNTAIAYHIENGDGKVIYSNEHRADEEVAGILKGSGEDIGTSGGTAWIDSFVPKNVDQPTFVLDGIYKTEPSDFSLAIKPKDIKRHPVSFDYKGNHLTIKSVKKPLFGDKSIVVKMEGGTDSLDSDFGNWIAMDGKGNTYPTTFSGSILDEKDKNGRHKMTFDLHLEGLTEVPEDLTLYLVSMRSYYPVDEQWKVSLTGEN